MITGIVIGFILTIVLICLAGGAAQKYAIKKGWYASAMWSEKEKRWKVRGRFLSISSKIHGGIVRGDGSVKYVE